MRTGLPIIAAILSACGGAVTTGNVIGGSANVETQRRAPPPRAAPVVATVTVRNLVDVGVGRLMPDDEFRLSFASAAAARQALGAATVDAFTTAGIRYQPAHRQFRDRQRAYAPLVVVDRGSAAQLIVVMNRLEQGEVGLCEGCGSNLGLIHHGRVIDLGPFDSNGHGSSGAVHLLTQSGPILVFGIHVGWAMQGEAGDSASLLVIGANGHLPELIPLLRNSNIQDVNTSAPLLRRRVRLQGDRLIILYPGMRPAQAVFRIGSARLELIEGRVPAALTQN